MKGVKVAYNLDLLVGTKISGDRYAIEKIIDDGGAMGLVCIAKDTVIDTVLIVKC